MRDRLLVLSVAFCALASSSGLASAEERLTLAEIGGSYTCANAQGTASYFNLFLMGNNAYSINDGARGLYAFDQSNGDVLFVNRDLTRTTGRITPNGMEIVGADDGKVRYQCTVAGTNPAGLSQATPIQATLPAE